MQIEFSNGLHFARFTLRVPITLRVLRRVACGSRARIIDVAR